MLGFKKRKLLYLDPHWLSNEPMSSRRHITELHSQKVSDSHPNMTFVFELRNQKKFQVLLRKLKSKVKLLLIKKKKSHKSKAYLMNIKAHFKMRFQIKMKKYSS